MPTDPNLLESGPAEEAREDTSVAFEDLLRLYQADVRVLTRRHFSSAAEADEVAQEIFVQVYRSLAGFRGEGSWRTWILAIARNQIRLHIRNESRRKRRSEVVIAPELLETGVAARDVDPFQLENAQAELDALRDCLSHLIGRQRTVVDAFYFQKQSAESIAEEIGQSAGAIRMLLMRIRKQLGECIRSRVTDDRRGTP